ncbi:hypothetical protein AACH06_28250 [Ideonella sp. DXS29W]|uniref:Uncharacterized protein n=1 Tax=Ideonella lacteola TaxID=2984193 RepID=A0ABU9BZ61_9BURK
MRHCPDAQVFKEALIAVAHGPFVPEHRFRRLFGIERSVAAVIAESFPTNTPLEQDAALTLRHAVMQLLSQAHALETEWQHWLSVTPAELRTIWSRWRTVNDFA